MIFKVKTALFVLVSFIGIIYCSPEGDKCCAEAFKEDNEKTTCSSKIDEGLQNGILPKEKHSELVTKSCKAVIQVKAKHNKLTPTQFGFLVSLGKGDEEFYNDFISCFPPEETDDTFFYLNDSVGLKRHYIFNLKKAISSGGSKWWTSLNTHDSEYLRILKNDNEGKYKTISINEKFQEFYHSYKKWVAAGEADACGIQHIFDAFHLNPELFKRDVEGYKADVVDGVKVLCNADNKHGKNNPGESNKKPVENKEEPNKQESKNGPVKTEQPKTEGKK